MKSVLSAHGFSETLFEPVTDLMVEDGYLKGVVSKRTGEVFGYWMTEDGYRRKNKLVREFGEALVVKAK